MNSSNEVPDQPTLEIITTLQLRSGASITIELERWPQHPGRPALRISRTRPDGSGISIAIPAAVARAFAAAVQRWASIVEAG